MKAVILFSHGSTLCGAGAALDRHAERLRDEFPLVEVGYLNYSTPTFEESARKVVDAGASEIVVVPFFLVPGYFVTKSLPDQVNEVKKLFPDVTFTIAPPLGADPLLADAVIDSALNPLREPQWRDSLRQAANSCRFRSDCPVYGTPECAPSFAKVKGAGRE